MDQDAPKSAGDARPWLKKIKHAEKAFDVWQEKCKRIDKLYANLERLASNSGDREFQIFWANLEVLKPTIYERAPAPVVMPRHSDLGEVVRKASEMLERALTYDVEADDLHDTLKMVRDDLALCARGVPWVLDNGECIHVERCDFLHEPARKWREVTWVARAAYLTKEDGVERFGDAFRDVETKKIGSSQDDHYEESEEKAKVWEIWCKKTRRIYYVTEGVESLLDESEPFIDVKGFYPCPKPAMATVEPGTLKPVPDFVYYRDQVDEINILTSRIHSLTESLRMKGFYAAGTAELGEAIETAMKQTSDKAILVPVSNFAAMGGANLKDSIIWLPVREIGELVASLVAMRKQLIEDVYEITGLSDIMRGSTEASETLGAQKLKAQFGNVRIRQKQEEMVRIALDVLRIKAEIFCETMEAFEIADMAAMQMPDVMQVRQMAMQAQQAGQQFKPPVTIAQVDQLFKSERIRQFVMEVETDSTIAADEQAEKDSRIEFITAVGGFMQQALPLAAQAPEIAPFAGEMLRFAAGGFRAGRDMGAAIDDLVETISQRAAQAGQEPSPEQMQAQADAQKAQAEMQIKQGELQVRQQEAQGKLQLQAQEQQIGAQDRMRDAALKRFELMLKAQEMGLKQDDQALRERQAEIDALFRMEEAEIEREQQRAVRLGDEG
ncbi:hypothetical protein [uncultured Roseobacter sp.]|uniref:hypothetical protein n=1 Tax=uncultured Roseobacter sp. TaxID=114847 RepID=UPI002636E765|nr:hypothetical protein [uncultured Roseobacter sp.]